MGLTVATLLSSSSPVVAPLSPAAAAPSLHTRTLSAGFGESAQPGRGIIPVIIHPRVGHGGPKAAHGGVSRDQGGVGRGSHHGATQNVADAVGGATLQLGIEVGRAELVEGVGHGVLAHGCLDVRGELVQTVVEEESPRDVGLHGNQRLSLLFVQ